jgi:branched-chain amino acid transport system substrate-binding protein
MMLVVLVAVTPVLASRVAQEEGVVTFAAGDSVKIGLATDLSNLIPAPGQDIANGAQLAVDEFNEAGGLQGFTVELVVEDDRCVGEDATSVANLFVSDPHIVGVVGHVCSGASIPASEVYQEARIPMVSPSSTAGAFTARGLDVANRVAFNDNIQGVVAARFIFSELGAQRIAVLHDNTSYGEGLASTVAATFEELGGEVITFEVVDPEEQDFRPVLTVLAGQEPDLIYLGGYEAQAALIVQQMAEVGLEDTIFFSDDGVYTATYLELAGDASEGTYVTFGAQVGDPEANEAFDERYEEKFGVAPDELGPFHAQAYDAATVILKALEAVATVDDAGNLSVDREALIEAVRTTEGLEGLSGLITCDENGDCGSATIAVFVAEGGEWVEVEVPEELQVSSES